MGTDIYYKISPESFIATFPHIDVLPWYLNLFERIYLTILKKLGGPDPHILPLASPLMSSTWQNIHKLHLLAIVILTYMIHPRES